MVLCSLSKFDSCSYDRSVGFAGEQIHSDATLKRPVDGFANAN